jgi:hypothetical protein
MILRSTKSLIAIASLVIGVHLHLVVMRQLGNKKVLFAFASRICCICFDLWNTTI